MNSKYFSTTGETLYTDTLPNGLRICVIPKPEYMLSYAVFAANYGGAHRRFLLNGEWHDTPAGVAHFLEHKLFDMPDGDNALNVLSANGAQPNAFTSSGMTAYYFDCTEKLEENLRMLLKFVSTPYFTEETVQKEQGIIGQEIGMVEDNPDFVIYNRLMRMLYEHNPVRDQVAGSVESIAEIHADTLYSCHKAFYAPSNMVLCVEGNVEPERIRAIAEELLPTEKAAAPVPDLGEAETLFPLEKRHTEYMETSAPQFLIGAKLMPEKGEAMLRQSIVSQLALRTLFGSSAPFYSRLYAEGLLNRSFDFETDFIAGTATAMLYGESPDPERVLAEVDGLVASVRKSGIPEEDFRRAKRASFGARLRGSEDFDSVCVSLAAGVFEGYCACDSFEVLQSVSREECERFICETLDSARLAMSVVLPLGSRKDNQEV